LIDVELSHSLEHYDILSQSSQKLVGVYLEVDVKYTKLQSEGKLAEV